MLLHTRKRALQSSGSSYVPSLASLLGYALEDIGVGFRAALESGGRDLELDYASGRQLSCQVGGLVLESLESHLRYMSSEVSFNTYTVRSHTCGELRSHHIGEKAKLCGWLAYRRLDRFLILRDAYGLVQARIPDTRKDLQELAAGTSYESVLAVEGTVESRGENSNPQMPTGAVEVETPTLFRATPGGASEFIVPAPKPNNGLFYTLPQSPQQFKQLLMCAGLDRYYQIARCYRNETSKQDRQLEFTQVDIELSFTSQEYVMDLVENIILQSWPESLVSYRPTAPFKRITYAEAYDQYGVDKPDLRISWKIIDFPSKLPFMKLSYGDTARCFVAKACRKFITRKNKDEWKRLIEMNRLAQRFTVMLLNDVGKWSSESQLQQFLEKIGIDENDAIVVAWGNHDGVQWTLGQLIRLVAEASTLRSIERFDFVWITEFPLFLYNDEEKRYESAHHPFTAPVTSHESLLYDKEQISNIKAQHYDLVLNGVELGGGSIRVHDSEMQHHILRNILRISTKEMEHLLQALSFGAPPHGGFALGLDRYIALLAGLGNPNKPIRDVIAFPKTKEGKDIMCGSPTAVPDEELER
ncbi:unnamed protein product [Enterobius vermicularis]|uniref:AA_TRNA_LIGASE_II domain-containing protein n=1 Tax=Enterobius vermicularis TaxID=51028 RepID=A0A0N4UWH7_ENTVE|nr:unnamed protein product [Enterobius vermicularis]